MNAAGCNCTAPCAACQRRSTYCTATGSTAPNAITGETKAADAVARPAELVELDAGEVGMLLEAERIAAAEGGAQ